jgi:hypothetical protein
MMNLKVMGFSNVMSYYLAIIREADFIYSVRTA